MLQAKLALHYPPAHPVYLVSAGRGRGELTSRRAATVGELADLLPAIHFGTTLYIPAASREVAHADLR